jgi:AMMECR1 domain-containing protein
MAASTRDELLAGLRPGTDGLVLDSGYARATFLPAVWKECPTAQEFVSRLLFKAGLPPLGWPVGMKALRFTAFEFGAPFPAITDGAHD